MLGKHDLPELVLASPECARGPLQIEAPEAKEPVIVAVAQPWPSLLEVAPPGHQRGVIVGAEVVQVLDDETPVDRATDLGERWDDQPGEYISLEPIDVAVQEIREAAPCAEEMQQGQTVILEALVEHAHEGTVVLLADVLEHADRDHAVEPAGDIAVVAQLEAHGQVRVSTLALFDLRRGERDAGDFNAVSLAGKAREGTPAAAYIQHAHAGLEPELAADQIELCLLGLLQGRRATREISARVVHARVEHGAEQVVAALIVVAGVALGAGARLAVDQRVGERARDDVGRVTQGLGHVGSQRTVEQPVDRVALPETVHIGLARTGEPPASDSRIEELVTHLDVPRTIAPDSHVRACKQGFDAPLVARPARGRRHRFAGADTG